MANFGSSGVCVNPNGDQPYQERAIYQESLVYDADILVLMLGTNDSKPENWSGMEAFTEDYCELVSTYIKGADVPKIYIGTPSEAFYLDGETEGVANYDIQPFVVDEIAANLQV